MAWNLTVVPGHAFSNSFAYVTKVVLTRSVRLVRTVIVPFGFEDEVLLPVEHPARSSAVAVTAATTPSVRLIAMCFLLVVSPLTLPARKGRHRPTRDWE